MAISSTYVVIAVNLITDSMIEESVNTASSYRRSIAGTEAVLKFNTLHPNTMANHAKYTHTEILQYRDANSADWEVTE